MEKNQVVVKRADTPASHYQEEILIVLVVNHLPQEPSELSFP